MYNLFLDDFRSPNDAYHYTKWEKFLLEEWIIVQNYNEFVQIIEEKGLPQLISFDHDLSDEHYNPSLTYSDYNEKTGLTCAEFLIDYCVKNNKKLPVYFVHSQNPIGANNIRRLFKSFLSIQNDPKENP